MTRGEVLMDGEDKMPLSDRGAALHEVDILSDSPVVQYQIVKSHTVRYKDCDPAQIVLSSVCQANFRHNYLIIPG